MLSILKEQEVLLLLLLLLLLENELGESWVGQCELKDQSLRICSLVQNGHGCGWKSVGHRGGDN